MRLKIFRRHRLGRHEGLLQEASSVVDYTRKMENQIIGTQRVWLTFVLC
jgi:hypothetical protein